MARSQPPSLIRGEGHLTSDWFSNEWTLTSGDTVIAYLRRFPRNYISAVQLADGIEWVLAPDGYAVVRATDESGAEVGRVTRRSWWGRRWDITGPGFAYELVSHPIPRRWQIQVGGAEFAEIRGSLVSYNTVTIDAPLSLPTAAAVLAWHVIARPWEAAAAPRGLVPHSASGDAAVLAADGVSRNL